MKHFKKMMALIIALVMVVGTMSMASFGATTTDSKIQITGLEDVDTVTFYQVLEWKGNDGAYAGWSLKAPFTAFANDYTATADHTKEWVAIRELIGDPAGNPSVPMHLDATIAGKLADLATSGGKTGDLNDKKDTASLTINDTNPIGLYMALITTTDAKTVYNPVFVSADFNTKNGTESWMVTSEATYYQQGAAKKSTIKLDKKAEKDAGTSYDLTWQSTRPGEVVHYTVDTVIPGYGPVYQHPHYYINDKLTGLKLVKDSVQLSAPTGLRKGTGTASETATGVDYFIEEAEDGLSYKITFTEEYLKKVNAPKDVTVAYDAVVTDQADIHVNIEQNEVWCKFSHDPQHEDEYDYEKDDTNHYTYTIDANVGATGTDAIGKSGSEIIKVGVDAAGNPITSTTTWSEITEGKGQEGPLAGAKFKLYKNQACTEEYKTVDNKTLDLESKADGRITIEDLDAGVYWLQESEAPNGYIAQQDPVKIEIVPEFETVKVTMYTNGTDWKKPTDEGFDANTYKEAATYEVEVLKKYTVYVNDQPGAVHTFMHDSGKTINWIEGSSSELPSSIVNTKGVELPSTGGIGTTIFYVIGAILVVGAGILLVTRRRMDAE